MFTISGMSFTPSHGSARVLVGLQWIFCIIVAAVYTGNLVAFLTVPTIPSPVDTLSQLADQNEYRVGVVRGQALEQILRVSNANYGLFKGMSGRVPAILVIKSL